MIGKHVTRIATFTRLANATDYSIGDAVSDNATTATAASFQLPGMGNSGIIKSVTLHKSDQDQTLATFDIFFFDTQPVGTGYEDNVAIAITDAEWARCIGFVRVTAATDWSNVVTGDISCKTNCDLPYQCVAGSTSLYYVIVAQAAYVPASGEIFTLRVGAVVQ